MIEDNSYLKQPLEERKAQTRCQSETQVDVADGDYFGRGIVTPMPSLCKCGCGREANGWNDKKNRPAEFIWGHNNRYKKSEETKIKMSEAKKQHWQREDYKIKKLESMKERYNYMRKRSPELHPLYRKPVSRDTIIKRLKTIKQKYSPEEISEWTSKAMKGRKSHRKGLNFEIEYGKQKAEEVKKKIKEARAKQITPVKDTSIELKIQDFLRKLGLSFFTHQYIKEIKHGYQCDIFIPSMNMVIECDGIYWHKYPTGTELDHIRTKELIEKGFRVLRLWEFEINEMTIQDFERRLKQ